MADPAQVRCVNKALFAMGQEPVVDLSAASLAQSLSATKVMRVLQDSRDTVLRRHGWLCALQYVVLPPVQLAGYTNWRYPSVFQLPGDALRVWEIEGCPVGGWIDELGWHGAALWAGAGPRWEIGTVEDGDGDGGARLIIRAGTDGASPLALDSLNLVYVRRANWVAIDAHVLDAIAYDAAARSAYSVTGDVAIADKLEKVAEEKAQLAISVDGTQQGGQPPLGYPLTAQIRAMSR